MYDATNDLLDRFEQYMTDPDAFYVIYDFLPSGIQYTIILNLLKYEHLLEPGNRYTGEQQRGKIEIKEKHICLTDKNDKKHTLCLLPHPYDI